MLTDIIQILRRSVTGPFYREYAGFFLFLFFLFFGTQPSFVDALLFHTALMKSILTSGMFFIIAMLVWLVYALKVFQFFYSTITKTSYLFLQALNTLPYGQRLAVMLYQQAILLLPATVYFLFVAGMGIYHGHLLATAGIFVTGLLLWMFSAMACVQVLYKTGSHHNNSFTQKFIRLLPDNLTGFLLKFCTQHIFTALLTIKLISFFCLYGLSRLEADVYEQRILWLIYISALIGHGVIVYKLHEFIESGLSFLRNMPFPVHKLLLSLLAVYTVLLLPEIWALKSVAIHQGQVMDYTWLVIFGPCFLLLIHGLLYTEQQKLENYFGLLFGIWIVFVFFSLSSQRLLMTGFAQLLALVCFYTGYYRYQPFFAKKQETP
ncbi:hypothetical protein ACFS6H_12760 [Terrimonas rubra]|uniref:Membrane protein involved in the export of O-antigen and teichoic acid n=1 Tax=Terrimonas rubra TaxID=1035890 RepID=A0ABW6A800_9BACT